MSQSDHINNNNLNNNSNRPCPQPLNISALRESLMTSSSNSNSSQTREFVDRGELTNEAFRYFKDSKQSNGDSSKGESHPPLSRSSIAALRESLMTSSTSSSTGNSRAKELFESGVFSSEAIRQFTEQRSGQSL
jgi:hypothetical protein